MHDLASLVKSAFHFPSLAHVYAFEIDRQLRHIGENFITFSAYGLADQSRENGLPPALATLFKEASQAEWENAIYKSEMLASMGQRDEALAYAFMNAQGVQIHALNLLYANYAAKRPSLRLHYLNKYLSAYGLHIELAPDESFPFFHRLPCNSPSNKVDGPLVTVIMPAHNAERTIELAVSSLLNQTWQNLQIIVVDDASTDGTLQKAKDLAKRDPRVEVLRSPVNVGPYVCRNLGIKYTRGQWFTVHDADDWAFPDRIEQQVKALTAANALACTGCMLRMNEQGHITRPIPGSSTAEDGYLRLCFVSLMLETAYFRNELGAWDSVRVGGDAELIERLKLLGTATQHLHRPLMLCLDHEAGLTNHQVLGLPDLSVQSKPLRADYKAAFTDWHKSAASKKMPSFGEKRPFEAPKENIVPSSAIIKAFAAWNKNLDLIKTSEFFDAAWYRGRYPHSEQTGMDAAEHYLIHGPSDNLDPGPGFDTEFYLNLSKKANPLIFAINERYKEVPNNRVLFAASKISGSGDYARALSLAEAHLPVELRHTAHILKANAALSKNNETEWQACLNAYLAHFGVAPIFLNEGKGCLFDRLDTAPLPLVIHGPMVSVIMPAWNAEKTVHKAAQSILNQSWRNLELLIVDDASTDGTFAALREIAASDPRVKLFRNNKNVGPYVSKNIALMHAKADWITGHDADDWAHPKRIEDHLRQALHNGYDASLIYMIRITPEGRFSFISSAGNFSIDGVARKALISCLFKRSILVERLGFWDSVRFGADSEMILRAESLLGERFGLISHVGMICLDLETSLTNHSLHGVGREKGVSLMRSNYRDSWSTWMQDSNEIKDFYLPFPQQKRRYKCSSEMEVPLKDILINLQGA